jgi:Calx-beta domain
MFRSFKFVAVVSILAFVPIGALASEVIDYEYDELGRLISVSHGGNVNNGLKASYCHDPAGNRTKYKADSAGVAATCDTGPPPTTISFAISDASGTEGDTFVFTVTKTGTTGSSISVNYATQNGTAGGQDYTAKSGTLTFAASETTKTVSVVSKTDTNTEADEKFYVNLSAVTGGATISDSQGVGTIYDGSGGCPLCRTTSNGSGG